MWKLIIFDVDGTLAERDTDGLLPGVFAWFAAHGQEYKIALATNQGGVGLRHWMETEGFGEPGKYPDEPAIWEQMGFIIGQLPDFVREVASANVHVCFAYQSKKSGKWAPTPADYDGHELWAHENRKPSPGMLEAAMRANECEPAETLMVGNEEEDHQAAVAAGCSFRWAADFFAANATMADPGVDDHVGGWLNIPIDE